MAIVEELPPGLPDMPPGPALAVALSHTDTTRVSNIDRPTLVEARHRQLSYDQALLQAELVELGRCGPCPPGETRRLSQPSQWADGEIAALLTWSERTAARELCFAEWIVTDLPQVHAAMLAGRLDRAKAWVFADYLNDLPAPLRTSICTALVGPASGWTAGWLANQLRRMILEHDPDWAARRYRTAVRERGVTAYLDQNGTMAISGHGLAPDEAAAAMARIDELAVEIRRAGHPSPLPQIRADLYLGLLDGSLPHRSRGEIITAMLSRVRAEDTEPTPQDTATATAEDQTSEDADATAGANAEGRATDTDAGPDDHASPPADQATPGGEATANPLVGADPSDPLPNPEVEPVTGVQIRVGLATLLGLDERCGQLGGFDYVLPEIARRRVAIQHRGAEWRFAVTDTDGQVVFGGLTRRRPLLPAGQPPGRCRGGIVELHISAELLAALTGEGSGALPAGLNSWAPVLADIAAQYADRESLVARLDARPRDRFPNTGLARFLCIRDRTCVAPGCRRSAATCQIDHTHDHAEGGLTTQANTAALCPSHHLRKTAGVWKLRQTRPGHFEWISPLGRVYRSQAKPLNPPSMTPSALLRSLASPASPSMPPGTPPANDPDPPPF